MPKGLVVAAVQEGSIAAEMEIAPGDRILAVDGQEITDIIDFQYMTADDEFVILVEKKDEGIWELDIQKSPGEYLGLEVEKVSAGGLKVCHNHCLFCFVAQMPKGMRKTLYEKDDDYRLSLSQGSFITLSNLSEDEFSRILRFHLSPLYISVHAWNPEERRKLLKNTKAGDLPEQITRLADAGITMHTQIVLVPGYNDGKVLEETVQELGKFFPYVQSIAVVPVGLTKFREHLTPIRGFKSEEAQDILSQGIEWQRAFRESTGQNIVAFSDEFYVLAGWDFPGAEEYDDFPQLENGVGMASKFIYEMKMVWDRLPEEIPERTIHLVTGISARHFFEQWKERLTKRIKGLNIIVHAVVNEFFGNTVTVAGLLTAGDIAEQLGTLQGEEFFIPETMLREDENVFLDDRSTDWLEAKVQGKLQIVENNGAAFLEKLVGYSLGGGKVE